MFKKNLIFCTVFAFLISLSLPLFSQEWPGRVKYPDVPYILSEDLKADYDAGNVIIVDVRSIIEFNVIHPIDTIHIPVSHKTFELQVGELISKNPGKKLAFYCNGVTCLKSYVATQKAMKAGHQNVFAYDAGVPEWSKMFPDKTLLLGKVITNAEKQIIPKSEFKKKCIPFEDFKAKALAAGGLAVDVRDHMQRANRLPGLNKTKIMPLDNFIPNFVEKKRKQDKVLCIFDQVGKQVRWLEYYLVENGYKNYYFLKGGATAVLKEQKYK